MFDHTHFFLLLFKNDRKKYEKIIKNFQKSKKIIKKNQKRFFL